MAKANMKQLVVDKGERYAFYAAGGIMLLLMIIGVMEMSDSPDPDEFVKDVNQSAQRIKSSINNPNADVPQLPDHARRAVGFPSVRMADLGALHFDPIAPPDTRRTNPMVRQVTEIEAKFMWAKIPALDIRMIDGKPHIGVMFVKAAKNENIDKEKKSKFMSDLSKRLNLSQPKKQRPKVNPMGGEFGGEGPIGPGGPGPIGPGGPGPIGPGGPGPIGPGGPGGRGGGRLPMGGEFTGSPDGPMTAPPPGPGGYYGGEIEVGQRLGVEYVPLDPEKLADKRLAITIFPQRMVVIHAAFPYREQIKEIARALRFKDESEVFNPQNDAAPIFKGFLIQRKILYPDKRVAADWHTLEYQSHYRETIFPRSLGDHPDPPELDFVKLGPEAEMVMSLPDLSGLKGSYYPETPLPASIQRTINKALELNKPPALPKSKSKLLGGGSLFGNNNFSTEGVYSNQPSSPEWVAPAGGGRPMPVDPRGLEGGMTGTTPSVNVAELPESVLIRLIDNDIMPGRLYQYRIKVLMQNPNWAGPQEKGKWLREDKFELVTHRQDAKRMLLGASEEDFGLIEQRFFADIPDEKVRQDEVRWNLDKKDLATPWQELKGFVEVPREEYFFGIDPPVGTPDPKDPRKMIGGVTLEPGQGLLQIQRWLPTANIKGFREPVADWVVADVLAKRGYYLGGEQFVNLPIWSSEFNRYVLRKVPPDPNDKQKEMRRGVIMDPTKPGPDYAVVSVEGGTISKRFGFNRIEDESATEILLVDPEGRLQVFSSWRDRYSVNRYMRDPSGPYVVINGIQVQPFRQNVRYDENTTYRAVDREEVWNKWVKETEEASRVFDPESAGMVPKNKFD